MPLTPKQRTLLQDIDDICVTIGQDFWNTENYPPEQHTVRLEVIKNQLVRGEIVMRYALMDEYLTMIICNYYFRRGELKDRNFRRLWESRKFEIFNHYIMDEIFVLAKMRIVNAIDPIPGNIQSGIQRLNTLRNDVAHSFFPQNRRGHLQRGARLYEGVDVFSLAGVVRVREDFFRVNGYLGRRARGD